MCPIFHKVSGEYNVEDFDRALRKCLTKAMKRSGKSRAEIADQMQARLGAAISGARRLTEERLYDLTSESKRDARFPALWVPLFCEVTGDDSLQRLLMGPRLAGLVEASERDLMSILKQHISRLAVQRARRARKKSG